MSLFLNARALRTRTSLASRVSATVLSGAVLSALAIGGGALSASAKPATDGDTGHTPVTICHWDNGQGGRWKSITVDDDSIVGSGHTNHPDIIPAIGDFPGLNWDAEHIAIYDADCAVTVTEPYPETTPIPIPTSEPIVASEYQEYEETQVVEDTEEVLDETQVLEETQVLDETEVLEETPAPKQTTTPTPKETYPGGEVSNNYEDKCIDNARFSYTWNGAAGTGSVIVTGGTFDGQSLCSPLYVRAASYDYDQPVDGGTPSWPQTSVGYNDYTIESAGTHEFETPGSDCGQDDVYATFDYAGFDALAVSPNLVGPHNPFEPTFLHDVVPAGTGGYTWFADNSYECGGGQLGGSQLQIVKRASAESVFVGTPFDYILEVKNTGDADAGLVVVTDMLPAGVTISGGITPADWETFQSTDPDTGRTILTFKRPSLAAGATAPLITISVVVNEAVEGGEVANTASVCPGDVLGEGEVVGEGCVSDSVVVKVPDFELPTFPLPPEENGGGGQLDTLALTGASTEVPLAIAIGLFGFGAAFLVVAVIRRRRVATND